MHIAYDNIPEPNHKLKKKFGNFAKFALALIYLNLTQTTIDLPELISLIQLHSCRKYLFKKNRDIYYVYEMSWLKTN